MSTTHHPWPRLLPRDGADHLLVVFSDIEMGAGGTTDDYPDTSFLEELIEGYAAPPFADLEVTFVFNGDTFDLLKTPLGEREYPSHINERGALAKLDRVLAAHPTFVDCLGRQLAHGEAPRRAVFIVGNHDQELFFEAVQARLRESIGATDAVLFPGLEWRVGDVHLEHGSQRDALFAIDPERPFVEHAGETLLNIPWGTMALLEVAMPYHAVLYPLDRLRPHRTVLDAVPEIRDFLLDEYWRYWTRDYWARLFVEADPLRRATWTMLSEIAYRFGTADTDVSTFDGPRMLREHADANVVVIGHAHQPGLWSVDGRRLLRTGCLRHEYLVDLVAGDHRLLPKVYAEVFLKEGRAVRSRFVDLEGRPPDPPAVPRSLGVLNAQMREHLSTPAERKRNQHARDAQLRLEGREPENSAPGFLRTLREFLEKR